MSKTYLENSANWLISEAEAAKDKLTFNDLIWLAMQYIEALEARF